MGTPTTESRFAGCLLGLAVGDACGAPYEGVPAEEIWHAFGGGRGAVAGLGAELGYTDDTEMAVGVAEHLVEHGRVVPAELMRTFVRNFDDRRGYGPGAKRLLEAVRHGGDWETLSQNLFPGGSFGNGAAMRSAPVGLLFHRDLDRASDEATLSALPTHRHPLGMDAARLVALAVALLVRGTSPENVCGELATLAATDEFAWQINTLARTTRADSLPDFGNTLAAHRSVGTAIGCFIIGPDRYVDVIARTIGFGGDTDTLSAIAGALAGAHLGIEAIPAHLLARLENGVRGRDHLLALSQQLFDLSQR